MIGKVTRVLLVLKDDGERHGVVGLPLSGRERTLVGGPFPVGNHKVVAVVRDLGSRPDPSLLIQSKRRHREHQWLHAEVELAVWLLAVDDVKAVRHPSLVVADSEVEPLVVVVCVDVGIQ